MCSVELNEKCLRKSGPRSTKLNNKFTGQKYLILADFIQSFHDSGSPWRTPSSSQPTWISCRMSHGPEISTAAVGSFGLLADLPPPPRNLVKKDIVSLSSTHCMAITNATMPWRQKANPPNYSLLANYVLVGKLHPRTQHLRIKNLPFSGVWELYFD